MFTVMTIALIAIALVAPVVLIGVWRLRRPKPIDRAEKEYWKLHADSGHRLATADMSGMSDCDDSEAIARRPVANVRIRSSVGLDNDWRNPASSPGLTAQPQEVNRNLVQSGS